jgi:aspartyl-tRNA(Asn)/glutamyl-tRNA(Gln) amidotransferase subunit A
MLGSYLLSSGVYNTYYYPAQQVRTLITRDYTRAFEQVDALLTPVSPRAAFRFGEIADPTSMYLSDIFTIPINIAGNGGLSLPVGLGEQSGLPVGVQIIGPQFKDENIIRVAAALESCYPDIARLAPLAGVGAGAASVAVGLAAGVGAATHTPLAGSGEGGGAR